MWAQHREAPLGRFPCPQWGLLASCLVRIKTPTARFLCKLHTLNTPGVSSLVHAKAYLAQKVVSEI